MDAKEVTMKQWARERVLQDYCTSVWYTEKQQVYFIT